MKENKFKTLLALFIVSLKVGLFTFGGGYSMISIIQKEATEKHHWISEEDMINILVIAESTPGPIAVNAATYIGFKVAGFWGSFISTLGLVIPSFTIIYTISLFYERFMSFALISAAFKGIKVGVIILLISALLKLRKNVKKSFVSILLFCVTLIAALTLSIHKINIPSLSMIFILLGIIVGIVSFLLERRKDK